MARSANPLASPDRIVAIDWSGRIDLAGQRRHIWAGIWTSAAHPSSRSRRDTTSTLPTEQQQALAGTIRLEAGRTRAEIGPWLIKLAHETPRMVVGFDFCFSYPDWFVRGELGLQSAPEFWQLVTATHGERWLTRRAVDDPDLDPRFWGKPHKRPPQFSGEHLHRMLRATDIDCKILSHIPEADRAARVKGITPKSVFQIGGSGSVGTGSLRGMPTLLALRAAGFRIWPFDPPQLDTSRLDKLGFATAKLQPLVVEMYTRLMTGAVHKANPLARAAYLARRRNPASPDFDPRYLALSRPVLTRARASEDAFDALISCMVMAARRDSFATLPQPRDPAHRIEGWTWAPEL